MVMNSAIDLEQAAFIKGSSMVDNIHLTKKLLRQYSRKHISPCCMVKVGLRKAYDLISWEFLEMVMTAMGFPSQFTEYPNQ